jgi:arsenate reductase
MAKGIGRSLGLGRFRFESAGISPKPLDPRTVSFMAEKGIDISQNRTRFLNQVVDLKEFHIFVGLCKEAEEAFPPPPTKMIDVHWEIENPSKLKGTEQEIRAAYEKTYEELHSHIRDLVEAVIGKQIEKEENE